MLWGGVGGITNMDMVVMIVVVVGVGRKEKAEEHITSHHINARVREPASGNE